MTSTEFGDLESRLRRVLTTESSIRPDATVQDMYKLMFQSCMGPGHLIADPERFRRDLISELESTPPDPLIPLVENITVKSPVARINLAAMRDREIPVEPVAEHCLGFNRQFEPLPVQWFLLILNNLAEWLAEMPCHLPADDSRRFLQMLPQTVPGPVHHSSRYRQLYRPHYRLIHPDFVDKWCLKI